MTSSESLRDSLRKATRREHDALDAMMSPIAMADHARFLAIQLAVRAPAEGWLRSIGFTPPVPPQANLLRRDLAELGAADIDPPAFAPADPREALGIAWALAGSSLGNRTMLQRARRSGRERALGFLSDAALPAYWAVLRPLIEAPADDMVTAHAIAGAKRVFAAFHALAVPALQGEAA